MGDKTPNMPWDEAPEEERLLSYEPGERWLGGLTLDEEALRRAASAPSRWLAGAPPDLPPGVYPPNAQPGAPPSGGGLVDAMRSAAESWSPVASAARAARQVPVSWGGRPGEEQDVMSRGVEDVRLGRNPEDVYNEALGLPAGTARDSNPPVGSPAQAPMNYAEALRQLGIKERTGGGSSQVQTTNAVLTPQQGAGFKSRLGEATELQKGAVGEKSTIAQSMYAQLADNSREQGHGLAAMMKAHEAKTADIEAKVNAQMADNAKMLQEIKAVHIDPEGIYNREGGGLLRARHAIGMALGAFGAALHGGGANPVLAIVNSQLDRDMKAQVANLKTKEFAFGAGRSIIGDLFAQTRDLEKSFVLGKMTYTDIAKMQVDAITKDAQSEEAKQNGIITMAKLDESQVESEMKLKQLEYKRIVRTQTSSAGGLTPGAQMLQQAMVAKFLAGQSGGAPAKNIPAKQAAEIGEMVAGYKNTEDLLKSAATKGGEGWVPYILGRGASLVKGTEAERYDSWRTAQSVAIAKMVNGGRPSPEDAKAVENLLPRYGEPNFGLKAAQTLSWMRARIAGQAKGLAQQGWNPESFRGVKGVQVEAPQPPPMLDTSVRGLAPAVPKLKGMR